MEKSPDAFRTISEVAEWLETPAHVLRFWESRFTQVKPVKRAGGRRYYRPSDMTLLGGIKKLLHDDGITIRGVQKILREQGVKHVCSLSPELAGASEDATQMTRAERRATRRAQREERQAALSGTTAAPQPVKDPDAPPVQPDAPESPFINVEAEDDGAVGGDNVVELQPQEPASQPKPAPQPDRFEGPATVSPSTQPEANKAAATPPESDADEAKKAKIAALYHRLEILRNSIADAPSDA